MRRFSATLSLLLLALATRGAAAQVIETPVPFDSAGRVSELTPAVMSRLGLSVPPFDVEGAFTSARLYSSSSGGYVLAVERAGGVLERHVLTEAGIGAVRDAVNAALARAGDRNVSAETDLPSQPASREFTRNQLLLGLLLYGPNLASLANDAKTGTVLYLLGTSGTYFGLAALTRNNTITRSQNRLATDGSIRGYLAANALLTAAAGDIPDRKTVAAMGLVGAVAGTLGGLTYGKRLTDSEAKAATTMSSFSALTAGGLLGTLGVVEGSDAERVVAGTLVAAGAVGYLLGPRYPRSVKYRVTVGDINTLWIGAAIGTAAAMIPIIDNTNTSTQAGFAVATAGMLGGAVVAERMWARPFDHSASDVTMMWLGTIAGGLAGIAGIVLVEVDEPEVALGLVTAGSAAGALITHKLLRVAPAGSRPLRVGRVEMSLHPANLGLAAARVPGRFPVVSLRF